MMYSRHNTDLGVNVHCVFRGDATWFGGDDVATLLGYVDPATVISLIGDEHKQTLGDLGMPPGWPLYTSDDVFITIDGVHSLVSRSTVHNASAFGSWFHTIQRTKDDNDDDDESIRSDDSVEDEGSLCVRLVKYIRKAYPDACAFVGRNESQRVDGILTGWQSGILVMRGTPDGFTNVFPASLDKSCESVVIALREHYKGTFKKGITAC